MTKYFLVKLTLWPIIFADLWQIDLWNFNTIRSAAMFLVWIVFTVADKVNTSRGKCILSVFSPVIPNTINKISFCFQLLRPISLVTVQSARPIVARVTNVRVYNQDSYFQYFSNIDIWYPKSWQDSIFQWRKWR
jgi:hypothetical protein